ncbi:hypothetical protein GCM10027200_10360 [Lentzea nigeriaca]
MRTTQKVATRPAVRVAAAATGSFRLAVCFVLCRPGIREHLASGTGARSHGAQHYEKNTGTSQASVDAHISTGKRIATESDTLR